jgi:ribosomal protein S18 acetylase RimI-like enzyme
VEGSILIRSAVPSDLDAVGDVLRMANAEFAAQLPEPFFDAFLENVLDLDGRREHSELYVAADERDDNRIVGAITFYPDASREGWGWPSAWAGIRAAAVSPAARRQRIGEELARRCIDEAHRRGARAVCLHTAPLMRSAIAMYEKLGFRRIPRFDADSTTLFPSPSPTSTFTALAYRLDLERRTPGPDRNGDTPDGPLPADIQPA